MNYFNRLYALVQEIEANTARLDQVEAHARQQIVRRPIPGELGTVAVGASGPISVDLNPRALRYTTGAALGTAVLRTITQAEAEFRAKYAQTMTAARREVMT